MVDNGTSGRTASGAGWGPAAYFCALLLLTVAMTGAILGLAHRSHAASANATGIRNSRGELNPVVQAELNEFTVSVSQFSSAPAGNVTFVVKNAGGIDHEMIVLKTDTPFNKIPIVDSGDPPARAKSRADKVDEATSVGETGGENLKPGETRTFTIKNLAAGKYVLVCNLATHYGLGMRAAFTVNDSQ